MSQPILIKAEHDKEKHTQNMTEWAKTLDMAKSRFRRLKDEGDARGLDGQSLIDYIKEQRTRPYVTVKTKSAGSAIANEERDLKKLWNYWQMFNFRPQIEISG